MELPPLPDQKIPFFTKEQLQTLKHAPIPFHVAIIPDGNRRWAREHKNSLVDSYLAGAQSIIRTTLAAKELGISALTIYSFSTENWRRPKEEIDLSMFLFDRHLSFYAPFFIEKQIRLHVIGNLEPIPPFLKETICSISKEMVEKSTLDLILAINYGGRDELVRAVSSLLESGRDVSEETISQALDTAPWPDPDLVIRTGGEARLSNFLLWQSSYAELYTEQLQWPDFSPCHLLQAVIAYQERARRKGS
jgi:undecaprenyl diphosphate synthase